MDATKIIMGAVSIIIGLVMLPLIALFLPSNTNNSSINAVSGLSTVVDLCLYGFTFGLVGVGVGLIFIGFKGK